MTEHKWNGLQGFPPNLDLRDMVEPVYRGEFDPEHGTRLIKAAAHRINWRHTGGPHDVVGYKIIHRLSRYPQPQNDR